MGNYPSRTLKMDKKTEETIAKMIKETMDSKMENTTKMHYEKELEAIHKSNRFRSRKLSKTNLIDLASNDYLGLGSKKKLFKKAYKLLKIEGSFAPKSSQLVNGYYPIHKRFEEKLCKYNGFPDGIIVGSGFLANISLLEGLVRKKDILFMDEEYHASGMLASKLVENVILFKHNDFVDLTNKIEELENKKGKNRFIIAIEGVYSMGGDIAPKEFADIAQKYEAILIVDEAHSSGVIGENLLGWYDYHHIKIMPNHIKMGTLGKAYGSYGAYILASKHIVSFLENRAKAIIYTTAPSLFDTALGLVAFSYIIKNKEKLTKKIVRKRKLVKDILEIETQSLILPIEIDDNKKVIEIQKNLENEGFAIGAIRQPTVAKAILRIILKLDVKNNELTKVLQKLKSI